MSDEPFAIDIEIAYALADEQQVIPMCVAAGTTAREALRQALMENMIRLDANDAAIGADQLPIGVYGVVVGDTYELAGGDRLEIYRALTRDPKERRRAIAQQEKDR